MLSHSEVNSIVNPAEPSLNNSGICGPQNAQGQPTHLTQGAIKALYGRDSTSKTIKDLNYVLQIVKLKELSMGAAEPKNSQSTGANEEQKRKSQVKIKLTLSDGVSSTMALMTETCWTKMTEKPKLFDVIRI
jgi:hypothetical protein